MTNDSLLLENELDGKPWTGAYVRYLNLREKGLRRNSMHELDQFILVFKQQGKTDRRWFINLIYTVGRKTNNYSLFIPGNLYTVFIPELKAWMKEEPDNPVPYRWAGDLSNLKRAVELDTSDQLSVEIFFDRLIGFIEMNQHEVQFGSKYDGDPSEDLIAIEESEKYIDCLKDLQKREKTKMALMELKRTATQAIGR